MFEEFYKEVGARLRDARISQLKTQLEVAERLGFARQNVSLMEKGQRQLDIALFVKWCDVLNIDPNALIKETRKYLYKWVFKKIKTGIWFNTRFMIQ